MDSDNSDDVCLISKETMKPRWEDSLYMLCQAKVKSKGLELMALRDAISRKASLNQKAHR